MVPQLWGSLWDTRVGNKHKIFGMHLKNHHELYWNIPFKIGGLGFTYIGIFIKDIRRWWLGQGPVLWGCGGSRAFPCSIPEPWCQPSPTAQLFPAATWEASVPLLPQDCCPTVAGGTWLKNVTWNLLLVTAISLGRKITFWVFRRKSLTMGLARLKSASSLAVVSVSFIYFFLTEIIWPLQCSLEL